MPYTFSKVIILKIIVIIRFFSFLFNFNLFFKTNFRNVNNKHFSESIKKKMKALPKASSQTELEQIFLEIEQSEENGTKGIYLKFTFF
jgi:hypothetical protein